MRAVFFLLFAFTHQMLTAAGGFFDSFAYVNVNGTGNVYYDLGATTGNPDYQSSNLGTLIQGQSLRLGGQIKTWKNDGTDITGVSIFYRYYIGPAAGEFTHIDYQFQFDNVFDVQGNQQWGTDVNGSNSTELSINILPASPAAGTYTLEVYVVVFTNGINASPEIYDSNMSNNYQATFTVEAPLNVSILQFSATEQSSKVHLHAAIDYDKPLLQLSFQKMSETNKSKSAWKDIAKLPSREIGHVHHHIDSDVSIGDHYYRLAITDADGSTSYSNVQKVRIQYTSQISIFPNPFINVLNIIGVAGVDGIKVVIRDLLGRIVFESIMSDIVSALDVSSIRDGMYTIQVLDKVGQVLHQQLLMK